MLTCYYCKGTQGTELDGTCFSCQGTGEATGYATLKALKEEMELLRERSAKADRFLQPYLWARLSMLMDIRRDILYGFGLIEESKKDHPEFMYPQIDYLITETA